MAKLYFYFASMNAGKSSTLLQTAFNYGERGMRVSLWTAALDNRPGFGAISSRIGLSSDAHRYEADTDIESRVLADHGEQPIACVLVDEAQFLTEAQVWQCARLADDAGIPVLCYGLRTDFQGALFPGSAALLGIAHRGVTYGARPNGRDERANIKTFADNEIGDAFQFIIGGVGVSVRQKKKIIDAVEFLPIHLGGRSEVEHVLEADRRFLAFVIALADESGPHGIV